MIWTDCDSETIRQELADKLETFNTLHQQVLKDEREALILFQIIDANISPEEQPFIHLLTTFSIPPEDVFTEHFPLSSHLAHLRGASDSDLRHFLRSITSYYSKPQGASSAHDRKQWQGPWEMQAAFPLLTLLVRLVGSNIQVCKIFEEEEGFGLLEILWHKSSSSQESSCRQIRTWVVIALGEVVYQLPSLDRDLFINDWTFVLHEVYNHIGIIEEALSIHSMVHHLLVQLAELK